MAGDVGTVNDRLSAATRISAAPEQENEVSAGALNRSFTVMCYPRISSIERSWYTIREEKSGTDIISWLKGN